MTFSLLSNNFDLYCPYFVPGSLWLQMVIRLMSSESQSIALDTDVSSGGMNVVSLEATKITSAKNWASSFSCLKQIIFFTLNCFFFLRFFASFVCSKNCFE